MNHLPPLAALALGLAAIITNSWIALSFATVVLVLHFGQIVLNRFKPEKHPDPTGAELLLALEEHKQEVNKTVESIVSKVNLVTASRGRNFRE